MQMEGGRIRRYSNELRVGLIALGTPLLGIGAWATVAPKSWFDEFPGGGRHWVSAIGPYNEHLASDVGAFFLAIASLLFFAAFALDRRLVQGALGALLVYSVPHLIYHLTELDAYNTTDIVLNLIALSSLVVVPLLMLSLTREAVQTAGGPVVSSSKMKGEVTYGTR
jgi:hypothetical protein